VGIETVQGTKSSQYQLIANDALEYFLLINDNTVADSTQTALKEFAKDYLLYQNRNQEAIAQFQSIEKYKGQNRGGNLIAFR
jgi:hypothetical protein